MPSSNRFGEPGDLDGVLEIEELSFNNPTTREWYERELQRPDVCFIYMLRVPEHPRGRVSARSGESPSEMHINNLAIRPELRGRGLGVFLLQASLDAAARLGASSATLEVRRSNVAARRLYARAGFYEAGVRRNYYTRPVEDALVLSLDFSRSEEDGRRRAPKETERGGSRTALRRDLPRSLNELVTRLPGRNDRCGSPS